MAEAKPEKKPSPFKTRALHDTGPAFDQDDWDQCLNIEECARESRKHDNSDIPQIIAMAAKCALEPGSTHYDPVKYESEDDEDLVLMPPKKVVKRDHDLDVSREQMLLPPSEDYRNWLPAMQELGFGLQGADVTPNSAFSSRLDSFLELSGTATWGTNGNQESHQFEIYEETEEDQRNAEQIAAELYDPTFNDDNKENEPGPGEAVAPRMDPLQEFDLVRTIFGELLDYNQHHLESPSLEATEADNDNIPEIVHGVGLLDDPFTSNNETTMIDINFPIELLHGGLVTSNCDACTDAQEVDGYETTEP